MNAPEPRRQLLLELFQAGLSRVDGRACVRDKLLAEANTRAARPVWVAAVGKAASAMMMGAYDALGTTIECALVITKDGHVLPQLAALGAETHESAHPMPDDRSLQAGERLLRWVAELPQHVDPLFLISGGSSSLVEVLEAGTSFADLERLTAEGLAAGIAIGELNARRARHSLIKGGRLTARLNGRPARAFFISDVPGDDPAVIGSGVLGPAAAESADQVERTVVASIDGAVEAVVAAATQMGLAAEAAPRRFDGDVVRLAVRFSHELHLSPVEVRVWGGESTVQLPEQPGRGGRNQHLGLAVARLIAGHPDLAVLAAGTDGTDGVTVDAGALVDAETWARLTLAGIDADAALRRADSGTALAAAGDLVHTGPTGTNVGDLVIGLKMSAEAARELRRRPGSLSD